MNVSRFFKAVALVGTTVLAWSGIVHADTTIHTADVTVVDAADVSLSTAPPALVRDGALADFKVTIAANDGNINPTGGECTDEAKRTATSKRDYVVSSGALATDATSPNATAVLPCQHFGTSPTAVSLSLKVGAGATAPLGRSQHAIPFRFLQASEADTGQLVTLGSAYKKGTFANPTLTVVVNPRAASTLAATAGNSEIDLDFALSADDTAITDYKLYRRVAPAVYDYTTPVGTVAKGSTDEPKFTDGTVTNGTEYCYVVRARFNDGTTDFWSTDSNEACATPVAPASNGDPDSVVFREPITANKINVAKLGRVVPVKMVVLDADGNPLGAGLYSIQSYRKSCDSTAGTDSVEQYAAGSSNLGNQFRLDDSGEAWIYNLNTKNLSNSASCWRLFVYWGGTADQTTGVVTGGTQLGSFDIELKK